MNLAKNLRRNIHTFVRIGVEGIQHLLRVGELIEIVSVRIAGKQLFQIGDGSHAGRGYCDISAILSDCLLLDPAEAQAA